MISAIIITKNEQDRIETCLKSLSFADELVIFDNGSTDKTLEKAKKFTKNIFSYQGQNFAVLRDAAFAKTHGDWVLYVGSDERVTESLKGEILEIVKSDDFSAYAISRRNIIFGKEVNYGPFWPDWVIRLFKRKDFIRWEGKVHESGRFNGELGYTKNSLIHLTHRDVDQIVIKSLEWSNIDAKLRLGANHPKITGWRLLRILFTEIFNQGILRRGFFSGTVGTMDALLQTFSMVITYIRLWQLQQPKTLQQIYDDVDKKLVENDFNL